MTYFKAAGLSLLFLLAPLGCKTDGGGGDESSTKFGVSDVKKLVKFDGGTCKKERSEHGGDGFEMVCPMTSKPNHVCRVTAYGTVNTLIELADVSGGGHKRINSAKYTSRKREFNPGALIGILAPVGSGPVVTKNEGEWRQFKKLDVEMRKVCLN